ncbi:cytochrome P450 [Truncatella angustata]|uniref:Cytochrome P450 n=1 Tax=Truncatella angustata TaxID=152316 RepID=A0A9P8UFS0_9PEZI|nr:cytochrome P450 [Truncatella angustata]KAH6649106.1 cytochrome P450 [Truncatella angustata]
MLHEAAVIIAGCIIFAYSIEFFFTKLDDPREPRRVTPDIPVIGHLLGALYHGFDYLNLAGKNVNAEIYTVGILNFKVYITHAPRLLNVMQKSKTLSVGPILQSANSIHSGASTEGNALFDGEVLEGFRDRTREALAPGLHLDEQNLRMGTQSINEVTKIVELQDEIELLDWVKHVILQGTSAGFYGMQHPFRDPEMETAMWDWDRHRPGIHIKVDPLRKGYNARAKVVDALGKYFENLPEDVSYLVRERQKVLREGGISEEDGLKMQAFLNDGNFNIVPTLYWTIYEIFSRPDLLEAIRQEVADHALQKSNDGFILDISAVKTKCHLLLSAYQETQRTRHMLSTSRMVLEDTLLDGQYLLKKGNLLYLPAKPIHHNTQIWGPQASVFDPYRFVPGATETKILPSNFLPWGSAPHICPTRQFISTGILVLMAIMVSRVNLTSANGRDWKDEPVVRWLEIATLPTASEKVYLKVSPRNQGLGKWRVVTGTSKTAVPLVSG